MTFSLGITLIFIFYMTFWIQLPGMLLCDLLIPHRLKVSTRLLASYGLGAAAVGFFFYLQCLFQASNVITVMGPLLSVMYIVTHIKKGRPSIFNEDEKFSRSFLIMFFIIYIASMLSFQFKYWGVLSGETTQVYHDFLFHTGNITTLSRTLFGYDIRVAEVKFFYHYFYELTFALCKHIFKMDAFRLYLNGNALVCAWPLSLALTIIGQRIKNSTESTKFQRLLYCGGLFVSCICLLPLNVVGGRFPISWLDNHLFSNGNAMGLALSMTVLTIDILVEGWYEEFSLRRLFVLFLLIMGVTGYKGTAGATVMVIAIAVSVIETFIIKKFSLARLAYVVTITIGFLYTNIAINTGPSSPGANNRSVDFTTAGTLGSNRIGQIFSKFGFDYTNTVWAVIGVILSSIVIIGPCILPFVGFAVSRFKKLIKEKEIGDIFDWFVIGSVLIGLGGFCLFAVPGFSQVYFVIANAAFIFYGSMKYCVENKEKWVTKLTYGFFALGTLFLVVDLGHYCYDDIKSNLDYAHKIEDVQYLVSRENIEKGYTESLVSKETIQAYQWLRDNTDESSRIAVDRFSEGLDKTSGGKDKRQIYFYASAFSERQCFIEGYDYSDITEEQIQAKLRTNEKFFSSDPNTANSALSLNGINYLVVTQIGHPDFVNTNPQLEKVFENKDVSIYKFKANASAKVIE